MTEPNNTTTEPDADANLDFDAFWARHGLATQEHVQIRGQRVPVPTDVPLWMMLRQDSIGMEDEAEVRAMVAELYGDHTLDLWRAQGMGGRELSVVLAWTVARAQGAGLTFAEAAERVEEMAKRPPDNRATRRAHKNRKKKR